MTEDKAVAVLVVAPEGIPLVRDPKKPQPVYWKLPGGRSNPGESAEDAAVRELEEELGLHITQNDLRLIYEEERAGHFVYFFRTELARLNGLKTIGDEGEEVHIFSKEDILAMPDLFPNHKKVVETLLRKE